MVASTSSSAVGVEGPRLGMNKVAELEFLNVKKPLLALSGRGFLFLSVGALAPNTSQHPTEQYS